MTNFHRLQILIIASLFSFTAIAQTSEEAKRVYVIPNSFIPANADQPGSTTITFGPDKKGAFWIAAILPDFRPIAEDLSEMNHGWRHQITALVEHPMHFRPGDDVAHDIMKFYKQTDKDGEEFAGCKRYSDGPLNDFRLCPTAEGKALVRCMRAGKVPFPSCTVREYMGNETSVTYSYPLAYSDQAIAIDKKLMSLFDKWFWVVGRQGCEKQGPNFVCR